MPLELKAVAVAAGVATVVASLMVRIGDEAVGTWVRRIFLTVLNLNPLIMGTWRRTFSRRETFLAAWLLAFIGTLVGIALLDGRV